MRWPRRSDGSTRRSRYRAEMVDEKTSPMRIGLLQCGHIRSELGEIHGDYPQLFGDLLADHPVELITYDLPAGAQPDEVDECDGWLISGSSDSVYDDLPWIPPAEDFLRRAVAAGVPVVGICFGHQLLAQALGGKVERSPRGWGAGAHTYRLTRPIEGWPDDVDQPASLNLIACHQDQVTELPAGAEVLASTDHCPVAAFTVGSTVLAIQPHPEFTAPLSRELTDVRSGLMGPERARAAIASLDRPLNTEPVAAWMTGVWRRGRAPR